ATEDQLHVVVEYVWNRLGEVFAILIAALAHDIPEQHAALRGIDHIFHGWPKYAEWCRKCDRRLTRLARWHWLCSLLTAQPAREGQHACRSFVLSAAARARPHLGRRVSPAGRALHGCRGPPAPPRPPRPGCGPPRASRVVGPALSVAPSAIPALDGGLHGSTPLQRPAGGPGQSSGML